MSLMQLNNLSYLTYGAIGLTGVILAIATAYDGPDEVIEPDNTEPSILQTIGTAVGINSTKPTEPSYGNTPAQEMPKSEPGPFNVSSGPQNNGVFGGNKNKNKNKAKKTKRTRGGKKARKTKRYKQRTAK